MTWQWNDNINHYFEEAVSYIFKMRKIPIKKKIVTFQLSSQCLHHCWECPYSLYTYVEAKCTGNIGNYNKESSLFLPSPGVYRTKESNIDEYKNPTLLY